MSGRRSGLLCIAFLRVVIAIIGRLVNGASPSSRRIATALAGLMGSHVTSIKQGLHTNRVAQTRVFGRFQAHRLPLAICSVLVLSEPPAAITS